MVSFNMRNSGNEMLGGLKYVQENNYSTFRQFSGLFSGRGHSLHAKIVNIGLKKSPCITNSENKNKFLSENHFKVEKREKKKATDPKIKDETFKIRFSFPMTRYSNADVTVSATKLPKSIVFNRYLSVLRLLDGLWFAGAAKHIRIRILHRFKLRRKSSWIFESITHFLSLFNCENCPSLELSVAFDDNVFYLTDLFTPFTQLIIEWILSCASDISKRKSPPMMLRRIRAWNPWNPPSIGAPRRWINSRNAFWRCARHWSRSC